jgi:uncharacterized membrane protein
MILPGIRKVSFDQPFRWLRAGARDMAKAWPLSLFYGVVFALIGYGLVHGAWDKPHLAMSLVSGFLFVAPVLATVFYSLSHRLEHHQRLPNLFVPLMSWRANPASLGLFAVMLVFILSSGAHLGHPGRTVSRRFGHRQPVRPADPQRGAQHADFVLAYLAFGGVRR